MPVLFLSSVVYMPVYVLVYIRMYTYILYIFVYMCIFTYALLCLIAIFKVESQELELELDICTYMYVQHTYVYIHVYLPTPSIFFVHSLHYLTHAYIPSEAQAFVRHPPNVNLYQVHQLQPSTATPATRFPRTHLHVPLMRRATRVLYMLSSSDGQTAAKSEPTGNTRSFAGDTGLYGGNTGLICCLYRFESALALCMLMNTLGHVSIRIHICESS